MRSLKSVDGAAFGLTVPGQRPETERRDLWQQFASSIISAMKPSSDSGSRTSETQYRADAPAGGRGAGASDDIAAQALLELVLQQTMAAYARTQSAPESVRQALRDVARRFPGESLSFEPCLVALVEAVIREPFAGWVAPGDPWDALCRRVAQTMHDDPTARARLEALWSQLQEPGS